MIVVLASYLAAREGRLDSIGSVVGACILVGPPLALVMLQPDLGTSLVFGAILAGMLWMAGRQPALARSARDRHGGHGAARLELPAARLPEGASPLVHGLQPRHPGRRIPAPPGADRGRVGRRVRQGPDQRDPDAGRASCRSRPPTSCSPRWPRSSGSSVASCCSPCSCSCCGACWSSGWRAKDPFGTLFAAGLASMILFQLVVNVGMVLGIMPITGIPLPFVTHGGASLVSMAAGPRDPAERQHPTDARRLVTHAGRA